MSQFYIYYLLTGLIIALAFLDVIFYDAFKDDFTFALVSLVLIALIWPVILLFMVMGTVLILATFYRGKR